MCSVHPSGHREKYPPPTRERFLLARTTKIKPFRLCIREVFFRVQEGHAGISLVWTGESAYFEKRKKESRLFQPPVPGFVLQKQNWHCYILLLLASEQYALYLIVSSHVPSESARVVTGTIKILCHQLSAVTY